jgi:hypothetical protein
LKDYLLSHGVVGKKKPEAKDWLGKDVKDSVGYNLRINANVSGSVSDTPDAVIG